MIRRLYEALFLVDSAEAAADWDGVMGAIKTVLERAEAEIVSIRKWDECRLAYEVNGRTRGTYILCYFRVDGQRMREIERDVQLSARIMRVLVLNVEHLSEEDVRKDTPATRAEKQEVKGQRGREVEKQEVEKQEAEKQEAEKQEAEKQEVEKQEAEKQGAVAVDSGQSEEQEESE